MKPNLQRIQQFLRASGLLKITDNIRQRIAQARAYNKNRAFIDSHPDFAVPPAHLAYDAYGYVNWSLYHKSGQEVAHRVVQEALAVCPSGIHSVLEWGCGPGRVIRWLPDLLPSAEVCGADYNGESIAWCKDHIPGVSFVQNALLPPLPLPNDNFNLIYAISVFTHLSEEVSLQWIDELARVLDKKDGCLAIWTNGDRVSQNLLPQEKAQYDRGEFVSRSKYAEGKKMYLAFHPPTWVQSRLLPHFTILQHYSGFTGTSQDVWLVKLKR